MGSYYQSDDFMNEIRKKSNETLKVKGLLSRFKSNFKKRNGATTKELYKNQLTEELIRTGEYEKLYQKYNNIPDNLQEDVYNAILINIFTQDEMNILALYEYEEPSIALLKT